VEPRHHTFLVTGGASGLGAATTRRLAQGGANVAIADLDAEAGVALARALGEHAIFVRADVTHEDHVADAIDAAIRRYGALHGAVHCAGIAIAERILGRDGPHRLETFRRVMEVNVVGSFNVLRLAAQAIGKNAPEEDGERGVIINTASIAAFDGQIGQVAYSASKSAVAAMTLPAARELARAGIRVVAIAPGVFETPMMASMSEEVRASLGAQVPFPQRLGRPDEFAALVVHVLENRMLNGTVIRLDGALRMAAK